MLVVKNTVASYQHLISNYSYKLKKNNYIDFNDMINLVLNAFDSSDELLKKVSSQFKYFLVDEYQ